MSYSRILLKTARTAGAVPSTSDLALREIAFDDVDSIYVRKTDGSIVKVGGSSIDGIDDVPGLQAALDAKAANSHTHTIASVTDLQTKLDGKAEVVHTQDASTIISGVFDIARIPAAALERMVGVANAAARLALTTATVQLGDFVKEADTGNVYIVTDQTQLTVEAGYTAFSVGTAASVPWTGVTGKPDSFTPSAHTHAISDVTSLQTILDGKAATSHTHAIATVTGLQTALDAKADATAISNPSLKVGAVTVSGANVTLDHATGVLFSHTATVAYTVILSGAPTSGEAVYILRLTNGGAFTPTWPSGIVWLGGEVPSLSSSGTDEIHLRRSVDGSVVRAFAVVGF